MEQLIIGKTADYVRRTLEGEGSGHDWWHIYRVWKTAVQIGKAEGAHLYVVELAALLHDIADSKFHGGDEEIGPRTAQAWLESLDIDKDTISHVCEIIRTLSFKGAGVADEMPTLEGRVVQDADRLDALGAIGIARAFAFGGYRNNLMHDPRVGPTLHSSAEEYKKKGGTTINHFYEKLLLLKDRMKTQAGKRMAQERHDYMERFLKRFFDEWEGKA